MKKIHFCLLFFFSSLNLLFAKVDLANLRLERLENPLGIESQKPTFSWQIIGDDRGVYQKSYRVLVASSLDLLNIGKADVWDSGTIQSDQSIDVPYAGEKLLAKERYYWTVIVGLRQRSELLHTNSINYWEMGMLEESDWSAKWIKAPRINSDWMEFAVYRESNFKDSSLYAAPLFRKEFVVQKKIENARLYISGIGYNVTYLNGQKIGDQVLDPAFTRYDKSVLYRVFDVTKEMASGVNSLSAVLGNGWYNMPSRSVWGFDQADWRDQPTLKAQLEITFKDGSKEVVVSDETWKTISGPIFFNSVYQGEFYDARKDQFGWNSPGYDDSKWNSVLLAHVPKGIMKNQLMPPIREVDKLKPIKITEPVKGKFVLDFGKNMTGYVQLKMNRPAGTRLKISYAERLKEDGTIDQDHIKMYSLDSPFQTDEYIFKGSGTEEWSPSFAYHGFQYMEVSGTDIMPSNEEIAALIVHTDFEVIGSFESSNLLFNKIVEISKNSYLTNFHGFPTDCPHREKNGWTGDAHLAAELGLLNFDASLGYKKWIADFRDEQRKSGELPGIIPSAGWGYFFGNGPAWDCSLFLIPWYVYTFTGDQSLIEENFDSIVKYMHFLKTKADQDYVVSWGLGDWCPANTVTPADITSTAYYYKGAELTSKMALLLGKENEARYFGELKDKIKTGFNKRFYKGNGIYGNGSQTSLACAIYQGLAEEQLQETLNALVLKLKENNYLLDCGILGTKYLLHALYDHGYEEVAYKIVNQKVFPSWGHWIEQGATSLWERWDGVNSRNHPMYGDVTAWITKAIGGIQKDEKFPGFKKIIIKPFLGEQLQSNRSTHQSRYGEIKVEWTRDKNRIKLNVEIPHNSSARVVLPSSISKNIKKSNNELFKSKLVTDVRSVSDELSFDLASGKYNFHF